MAAGVPFALLAAVQFAAVAGWAALAAAVALPALRRRSAPLVAAGAVLAGAADAFTGSALGSGSSDRAAWVRAAAGLLLAAGLLGGAPGARPRPRGAASPTGRGVLAVAPLVATPPGSVAAAGALAVAALLALRRPATGRWLLAAGLLLAGAAAGLSPYADTGAGAVALLGVRGAAAVALLGWAALLARGSLLAKVVGSSLAALLAASLVVAVVVGTVVSSRLGAQQVQQVRQVAEAERAEFTSLATSTAQLAAALAASGDPEQAARGLAALNDGSSRVVAEISRDGVVRSFVPGTSPGVQRLALDDLARQAPVREVLATRGGGATTAPVVLAGTTPVVVLLSAASRTSFSGELPQVVRVYGVVLDAQQLRARRSVSTFDSTLLTLRGEVAATTLSSGAAALRDDEGVLQALAAPPEGGALTRVSQGAEPTLGVVTLLQGSDPVALLVVSAPAEAVSSTQRAVLRVLFVALLTTAAVIGLLALLLGRQVVGPVRRLTETAERVRAGNLSARAAVSGRGSGRDEVGRLAATFDAMTDSLAQANAELRATAEQEAATRSRLETVLASIADGLVVADADGLVESVNPAAEVLVGPAAGTVGRPLADVVRGVPLHARAGEGLLRRRDGSRVPVVVASEPLAGGGVAVVLRDTTRERQVERMKTEFLSNVSHELRTPLTPIRGYADILARRAPSLTSAQTSQYAGVVLQASARLTRVVDLLVDVAALDAGRVAPVPAPLALGPFVANRLAAWRERVPDRAGDLRRRVSPGLPAAYVDAGWLARAVDELLDNALKFSEPGTPVTLAAAADPDTGRLTLAVRDAGEGIPAARREALFADFEQVDGSATRSRDGLGLGLAFVRRVADVVGLRLSVATTPGRGSTFTLEVPVLPVPPAPRAGERRHRRAARA